MLVVGLGAVGVVSGFAYWEQTRFPARSQSLPGTPIELRIQSGVKPRELRAIRMGLRAESRFMAMRLHRTVRRHVEARVARSNSCRPFQSAGESVMGEGDAGFLCINTANLAWQYLVRRDFVAAASISAHEYVHVLQAELGCLRPAGGGRFRWLMEGMAEHVGWRALESAGLATEARVLRAIRADDPLAQDLGRLRAYERDGGRDQEYALWHLAVRYLMRVTKRGHAAPAGTPELALVRFCVRVGSGEPWQTAFGRSFGMDLDRFYVRFEADRRRGAILR